MDFVELGWNTKDSRAGEEASPHLLDTLNTHKYICISGMMKKSMF